MFIFLLVISFLTKFFNVSAWAEQLNMGGGSLSIKENDHLLHVLRGMDDVFKDLVHLVEGDVVAHHAVQLELMPSWAVQKPIGTMVAPLAGMPISSRAVREPG